MVVFNIETVLVALLQHAKTKLNTGTVTLDLVVGGGIVDLTNFISFSRVHLAMVSMVRL